MMQFKNMMAGCWMATLCLTGTVQAHPHVFVDAHAGFQIDADNYLQALQIAWQYDAFTTLFLFDALDLDSDADGQLSADDLATVASAETDWPPDYNGDVHLEFNHNATKLTRPENAKARMVDGQIIVSFDLPLASPVDMSGQHASLRLYDPVFYYAYSVNVMPSSQQLDAPCRATANPFKPNEAEASALVQLAALSREETPDEPDIGAQFSDEVVLTCR